MRFSLRTLLIVTILGPPLIALAWINGNAGPSIALGVLLVWSYELAAGVLAGVKLHR